MIACCQHNNSRIDENRRRLPRLLFHARLLGAWCVSGRETASLIAMSSDRRQYSGKMKCLVLATLACVTTPG